MARRVLGAVGLGVLIAVSVVSPASAKGTPYFTVEISPPQPVAGEAVVVAVRTWDDVAHTIPARFDSAATLQGLLVLRSAAGDSPDVAVPLQYQAPDEFRATVVVPSAGDWKLVAFPDRSGWAAPDVPPGYPDSIALTVRAQNDGVSTNAAMGGLAALMVIVKDRGDTRRSRSARAAHFGDPLLVSRLSQPTAGGARGSLSRRECHPWTVAAWTEASLGPDPRRRPT